MGTVTFNFAGEVALITGGSRGLGLEIAQAFGAAGATVVITARRKQWLNEAEQTLKDQGVPVHAFIADVADPTSVENLVQQALAACGKIDVLVNNAGLTWGTPAEEMPRERWRWSGAAGAYASTPSRQDYFAHVCPRYWSSALKRPTFK